MTTLRCLFDVGECTLLQVAEAADIPVGRSFAALASLVQAGDVAKTRRGDSARYTITKVGEAKVRTWLRLGMASAPRGGAGRGE
ncbi:hypothetical protein [Streptomyces malaysiensis]|uniref:hypothetical protein n=1 Tax=Streptomyces malaysiensis TaxID=92644 RepID=UPI00142EB02D|nr:hypothetical protein [Streptomyces malaysiensis]